MADDSPQAHADRLTAALAAFDWDAARAICAQIMAEVWTHPGWMEADPARQMLHDLRTKRQFALLERMAETFLVSDLTLPNVRRQYAQALIDQGRYAAAEAVLRGMLDLPPDSEEHIEALGLLGRLNKQLYVNPGGDREGKQVRFLFRALTEYLRAYLRKPEEHYWHGINVVALLARADRDGIAVGDGDVPGFDREKHGIVPLAHAILASIERRLERARAEGTMLYVFEYGTRMEAFVALGRFDDALLALSEYVTHPKADAFELASTERQLREVWQLDPDPAPASGQLLSILRAVLLKKEGGKVTIAPGAASEELKAATEAAGRLDLEAVLGAERFQTLEWYRRGLECCGGIVRIENRNHRPIGTGWITDGGALLAAWAGRLVIVTNKHVVSPSPPGSESDDEPYRPQPGRVALLPQEAQIFHELSGIRAVVGKDGVLWSSDDLTLDTTVIALPNELSQVSPLTVNRRQLSMTDPPERVYVLGHPDGRGLEFSLQDNVMLDVDVRRLHYRAPTEGGSSGSPVFDDDWRVIALHHAGGRNVPRLKGGGRYDANEGILARAIASTVTPPP